MLHKMNAANAVVTHIVRKVMSPFLHTCLFICGFSASYLPDRKLRQRRTEEY